MPRIAPIAPEAMSPELRKVIDSRPPYAIYRVLANAPTVLPGFIQLAGSLLTQTELDPQLREMVILRVGVHCKSGYEIHQHLRLARAVGTSEARIEKAMDLGAKLDASANAEVEDLMLAFTDAVVLSVKAPKDQFDALLAKTSARGMTELLMTIGTYMMVSRVLENLEVEIEEGGVDIQSRGFYPNVGTAAKG